MHKAGPPIPPLANAALGLLTHPVQIPAARGTKSDTRHCCEMHQAGGQRAGQDTSGQSVVPSSADIATCHICAPRRQETRSQGCAPRLRGIPPPLLGTWHGPARAKEDRGGPDGARDAQRNSEIFTP